MAAHLEKEGLQFIQFAFRWVNCLLLREVPFALAVRLWDTYLAEGCAWGCSAVVRWDASRRAMQLLVQTNMTDSALAHEDCAAHLACVPASMQLAAQRLPGVHPGVVPAQVRVTAVCCAGRC